MIKKRRGKKTLPKQTEGNPTERKGEELSYPTMSLKNPTETKGGEEPYPEEKEEWRL